MTAINLVYTAIEEPTLKTTTSIRIDIAHIGHPRQPVEKRFCNLVDLVSCNASNTKGYIGESVAMAISKSPRMAAGMSRFPRNYYYEEYRDDVGTLTMNRVTETSTVHMQVLSTPSNGNAVTPRRQITIIIPSSHALHWIDFSALKDPKTLHLILDSFLGRYNLSAIEPDLGYDEDYNLTFVETDHE